MNPSVPQSRQTVGAAGGAASPWCPDCGDGTYRNPVLFADYSDPDAIRVGDDYWLTASSFSHVPGLPILHSHDLVNWSLVNHALPRLVPDAHFARPRHGEGVWAPSIRFHQGRFWIYYPDPDFGIYVVTAADPRGRWSAPVMVKAGKGLIDPCPYWDSDGTGYLVHGWARSRAGIANRLTLHRLALDHCSVTDPGRLVIDGDTLDRCHTLEGPKLYRRGEYYYLFAPAGGVAEGYQAVFRARTIAGPYEGRIVLERGSTAINGPHQGAWVDTPEGGDWFLHFQQLPAYGRVVHLQPMRWREGWPVMGDDADGDGKGEPVLRHAKPRALHGPSLGLAGSDEFAARTLGLQWQWQANPRADFLSLTAEPGRLSLSFQAMAAGENLWHAPNLLLQKFSAPEFVATTEFRLAAPCVNDRAGLIVFGFDYAWAGLVLREDGMRLVLIRCLAAHQGGREEELHSEPFTADCVQVRVTVGLDAECTFARQTDEKRFCPMGPKFRARSSTWVGAKVGVFATGLGLPIDESHATFHWFNVTPA